MSRVLPILFNTEMVQAILDGRKTVTRRLIKQDKVNQVLSSPCRKENPDIPDYKFIRCLVNAPCEEGDILYVRETWCWEPCWDCGMNTEEHNCGDESANKFFNHDKGQWGCYEYKASLGDNAYPSVDVWHPSIHMPKDAARIWLKVTDVRVEKLQDISGGQAQAEGFSGKDEFIKTFLEMYPYCTKESWLWVIEFEQCGKPESEGMSK